MQTIYLYHDYKSYQNILDFIIYIYNIFNRYLAIVY